MTDSDCRIDGGGVIKVADFGLAEDMYSGYFRQDKSEQNVKLPFKWMPLESLQEGLFSEKSDVVSYMYNPHSMKQYKTKVVSKIPDVATKHLQYMLFLVGQVQECLQLMHC